MTKFNENFKKVFFFFFSKRFLIYTLIGSFNTFNCVVFSTLLELARVQENLAFAIGYMISLTISYICNSLFNFKRKLSFLRYSKFCISYIPNFIIQNIVTFIFFNIINVHHVIAYIVAALLGTPVTFLFLKVFAFGEKKSRHNNT
ncbi:MAG: GtrA family protein [Clostridia bacterium]|nr:GtrA family protein [Clostridia bacterium]